jgi:hypothetical protein
VTNLDDDMPVMRILWRIRGRVAAGLDGFVLLPVRGLKKKNRDIWSKKSF